MHEITIVDDRVDGWTSNPRLGPGMNIGYVAVFWNALGEWDFTWDERVQMPPQWWPTPVTVQTKRRFVQTGVASMVCLDAADDHSDGEASFTIKLEPSGAPATESPFSWDPMESGSAAK